MLKKNSFLIPFFVLALFVCLAGAPDIYSQGNSKSKSKSASAKGKSKEKANQADKEKSNAKSKGKNGNPDDDDRKRKIEGKLPKDKELNRYRGIAKKLDTSPEKLRERYRAELYRNPDLKFGNFVSAHVVADNLNDKNPRITSGAILDRMGDGLSLGQALKDLGMSSKDSKNARKKADKEIEKSKKNREEIY